MMNLQRMSVQRALKSLKVKIKDDLVTKAKRNAEKKAREAAIDSHPRAPFFRRAGMSDSG